MKRYFILIMVVSLLTSGLVVGCVQNKQKQQLEELLDYLDAVSSLEIKSLEAIGTVLEADKAVRDVITSRDEYRLLEVEAMMQKAVSEALDTVNSALSSMENLVPPPEARTLHRLMTESFQTSQKGLVKLSYGSTILYDKAYSMLHRSVPKKEYPDTSEVMKQGRQLIQEAFSNWEEVGVEMDNLLEFIGQKVNARLGEEVRKIGMRHPEGTKIFKGEKR